MMKTNPVKEFLAKGDYSFEEGVAVLLLYSANSGVNSYIIGSKNKKHLHYELARLAHFPKLSPVNSARIPSPSPIQSKPAVSSDVSSSEKPSVSYLDLNHHKNTRLEDMPTDLTKELWVKNRDQYKELQHAHQAMKQANSDSGRASWRKQVILLDSEIKKRWALIDSEIEKFNSEKSVNDFNISTYRSYISKALKKKNLSDKQKVELQNRVDSMLNNNLELAPAQIERLKAIGIKI